MASFNNASFATPFEITTCPSILVAALDVEYLHLPDHFKKFFNNKYSMNQKTIILRLRYFLTYMNSYLIEGYLFVLYMHMHQS